MKQASEEVSFLLLNVDQQPGNKRFQQFRRPLRKNWLSFPPSFLFWTGPEGLYAMISQC